MMGVAAFSVKNEPPRWIVEKVQAMIARGYSAKRISELVDIPQWYAQLLKDEDKF